MAGYSGTPLAKKLGIKAGDEVLLDGAPAGFTVDGRPDGVTVRRRAGSGPYPVIVAFCPDLKRLRSRWDRLHELTTTAGVLWIAWPKKASGVVTDLTENAVREHALAHGRVDVKVCAIDDVWSGLANVVRVKDRS